MGTEAEILPQDKKVVRVDDKAKSLATALDAKSRLLALSDAGLERKILYETVREGLLATITKYDVNGEKIEIADHATRSKFIGAAIEILGEKAGREEGVRVQPIILMVEGQRI